MLELKKLENTSDMAKKILEKYDYDGKKCKEYIMLQYIEAEADSKRNQYWLDVGCNVEEQLSAKKTTL